MAVNHLEIKGFLVFKDEFKADFVPGANVIIGGNGTGKTTLLKAMYNNLRMVESGSLPEKTQAAINTEHKPHLNSIRIDIGDGIFKNAVYIPEKDLLEHAKGLLPFMEEKQTGFSHIYKDVLVKAMDVPTQKQTELQKVLGDRIAGVIGGHITWDQGDGNFYTIKTNGGRIPFSNEASGFKKLGFLGLLIASGQIVPGTVLFWDEPENSLNPELVPVLVDILLELSRNGVQIFIATHSEILAEYFSVLRKKNGGDEVKFFSLYKDGEKIGYDAGDRFDLLTPNSLAAEPVKLYELEIERGLGGNG
ncbi:MAG: AAA family ATPase [Oscillospiraceae bacterium]|jgi:predicted ATPase|nr:AAA family ATPase [Oscillospiraceae bacterium]